MGLEYSWTYFQIRLEDISFESWAELEEPHEKYGWSPRDVPFAFVDKEQVEAEWEAVTDLRYSAPKRRLFGAGYLAHYRDTLYIGVPEDKNSLTDSCTERANTFRCKINEQEEGTGRKYGFFKFLEENEAGPGGLYLTLHLPRSTFEEIERIVSSSVEEFRITCHIKCWNYSLPDCMLFYVDKESASPVELSRISLKNVRPTVAEPDQLVGEDRVKEDNAEKDNSIEPLLLANLQQITKNLDSLKMPLWLAAIAAVWAVLHLVFK